jgi:hypothetical protein
VETGDIVPDRSNGDLRDDSGGVGRGVGEGEIRENESRRGGRCIVFTTDFPNVPDIIFKFTALSRENSSRFRAHRLVFRLEGQRWTVMAG